MRAWAVGFFLLVVFFVALAVRLRVLMACALWSALCARLGAVCAAGCCVHSSTLCVDSRFAQYFFITQRDKDVLFLCPANSRLLLLARRCYGSSDETGRRCCVEPNVDWSRLLAVVNLRDTEFQLL